jgi:hypothetical protein
MGLIRGLLVFVLAMMIVLPVTASAANCGGATPCNCLDTVTSDYVMPADLSCADGLFLNTAYVTFDCNYHSLSSGAGLNFGLGIENDHITIKNCIIDNYWEGLYAFFRTNITIENTVFSNHINAISMIHVDDVIIRNVTMTGNTNDYLFNYSTNATFEDTALIEDYYFEDSEVQVETSDAVIELTETVNSGGSNLSEVIIVKPNNITINTNIDPAFDKPANLTLYNINYVQPKILKDGVDCNEPECYILNYDALSDTLKFNVTGFSSFTAAEGFTGGVSGSPGFDFGLIGILMTVLLVVAISASGFFLKK